MPDFMKLAEAYGWHGILIETPDQPESGIQEMIDTDKPVFVDCRVANLIQNCFPMIPSGAANMNKLAASSDAIGEDGKKSYRGIDKMSQPPKSAYSIVEQDTEVQRHTFAVIVDNRPGILARVVGMFSARGYNIESLTVSSIDKNRKCSRKNRYNRFGKQQNKLKLNCDELLRLIPHTMFPNPNTWKKKSCWLNRN